LDIFIAGLKKAFLQHLVVLSLLCSAWRAGDRAREGEDCRSKDGFLPSLRKPRP